MKQRLCLAKTLVHDPPVLILDEPASGLDPRARLEMKALLTELKGMGKTILVSSHILSELADCCTSIGIIERGKLLAAGSIQDIQRVSRELFTRALPYMLKAYEMNPKRKETLLGLEGIYYSLQDNEKSEEYRRQYEALEPKDDQ
jgi:ABC-type multidrug transport system ATPase subunit